MKTRELSSQLIKAPALIRDWKCVGSIDEIELTYIDTPADQLARTASTNLPMPAEDLCTKGIYDPFAKASTPKTAAIASQIDPSRRNPNPFAQEQ